ncbi:glycosyltransferase [Robertmurraya sp. P23]|uniref:glycosyltransferase n=1 Tax=Robertmurraya sp. P23 TaxID=3436931 RepID=UPI003D98465C
MLINMNIGGTEKALLNMINEMSSDQYDVTILMLEKKGGFLKDIPSHVKVEELYEYKRLKKFLNEPLHLSIGRLIKEGKYICGLILGFIYLISKINREYSLLYKYLVRDVEMINNEYDIAIAYAGPMDFISYFVVNRIRAKKKFQWIHFDVTKIGFNTRFAKKYYKKFDKIFVVSEEAKIKLHSKLPSLKGFTQKFTNIVSTKVVQEKAKEKNEILESNNGEIKVLTVGRLSKEKGQDLAIRVLARLKNEGYKIKWFCLGEGPGREDYEKLIKQCGIESDFILLGSNSNPYPFMEQCDIYVQPSRYEGYCLTIMEAMCLNKPILSTEVNGVREQIVDNKTGIIVPVDENELYLGLKKLVENRELRRRLSNNLSIERETNKENTQKYIKQLSETL